MLVTRIYRYFLLRTGIKATADEVALEQESLWRLRVRERSQRLLANCWAVISILPSYNLLSYCKLINNIMTFKSLWLLPKYAYLSDSFREKYGLRSAHSANTRTHMRSAGAAQFSTTDSAKTAKGRLVQQAPSDPLRLSHPSRLFFFPLNYFYNYRSRITRSYKTGKPRSSLTVWQVNQPEVVQ